MLMHLNPDQGQVARYLENWSRSIDRLVPFLGFDELVQPYSEILNLFAAPFECGRKLAACIIVSY